MFVESIGNAPRNLTDIHVFAAVAHVHGVPLIVKLIRPVFPRHLKATSPWFE
ncbi:hypothetical protein EYR03_16715 [Xanthomonas oryzae pv. oryzae]|nr:hypothetical protein EYR03_16715 [Xanthomonas oryzae pv. oryzae]